MSSSSSASSCVRRKEIRRCFSLRWRSEMWMRFCRTSHEPRTRLRKSSRETQSASQPSSLMHVTWSGSGSGLRSGSGLGVRVSDAGDRGGARLVQEARGLAAALLTAALPDE
eukprot:scaffold36048_cov59-Phaeocystis_antarctica.AAC.1